MPQYDFGNLTSPLPGSTFINEHLEEWRDALHSCHMGDTRPSYAVDGMIWINNDTTPYVVNFFTGSVDIPIGTIDPTGETFTASNSQVVKLTADDPVPNYFDAKLAMGRETVKETVVDGGTGEKTVKIDIRQNAQSAATPASGTTTSDIANGIVRKITPSGNFTMAFTFDSGKMQSMLIRCVNFGAFTITWPAGMKWPGGVLPDFTASGEDHLMVYQDTENNVYGALVGLDMKTV